MTDLQIFNEMNGVASGLKPGEISTGTTILALPYEGGILVCADSRTSTGTYVANRVSDKLVQISEQIYVCRSGSAADTQTLTDYVHYYLNQWRQVQYFIYSYSVTVLCNWGYVFVECIRIGCFSLCGSCVVEFGKASQLVFVSQDKMQSRKAKPSEPFQIDRQSDCCHSLCLVFSLDSTPIACHNMETLSNLFSPLYSKQLLSNCAVSTRGANPL